MGFFPGEAFGQRLAYRVVFLLYFYTDGFKLIYFLFGTGGQFFFLGEQVEPLKIEPALQWVFGNVFFAGFTPYFSLEHLYLLFQFNDGLLILLKLLAGKRSVLIRSFDNRKAGFSAWKFPCTVRPGAPVSVVKKALLRLSFALVFSVVRRYQISAALPNKKPDIAGYSEAFSHLFLFTFPSAEAPRTIIIKSCQLA